ncbi:RRP12-like protein [Diaphorina citri]|uniref:RRP12-like protein n=1 Tax=Diaphorina citri TaxID=121845 RepID=A0A1S3D5S7_DIACI|nr:RRP12-like protein [Diaphorina citri]
MSYQYNKAWKQILHILALMFKAAGATCHEFMVKCLQSLAELRDSYNFPYVNELDYAVGAAVRTMGVDVVLRHVPYQISFNEKGNEIKRSWMLPVLKANIQNASIGFFIEHFLPLASQCRKKSEEFRQSDSTAAAVSYDLLQTQIWSLLPSFCNKPKDIESFPKLAKVLGNVLINFKDLRLTVMLALRKLMEDNPECPVMRKYAKNYLPSLCMHRTPQLNAQLINALYDYQPPSSDSQPTLAWLTTLQAAFGNLARIELGLCMSNLHRFMSLCTQLWLSDKIEVVNGATHTVQVLIQDCVEKAASPDVVSHHKTSLHKIFQLLEQCMSYQYNKAWKQILHILALMFKAAGATCHEFMVKCLQSLAELRDSYNFPYVNELDYAVGAAVRTMGVDVVLRHVPYQISFNEKGNEIKRSWMLPVLKANIQNASIGFFIEHFLPLASQCRKKSEEFRQSDSTAAAVSYDLLQTQIWSLLPSFCNKPKDIESFPKLAKVLGNVLINFKDLRLTVMLALRKLMEDNPECPVMRKYAKNYLPILLNIYTTQPKGTDDDNIRTSTFQTIAMYASRAEQSLLHELLESAVIKIKKATENTEDVKSKEEMKFLKSSILDVIRVLLPYQHVRDVEEVFKFLQNTLKESKDSTETKKVYRILQELCESEQKGSLEFISNHLDDVIQVLLEPMESKTLMPSQAARVKCLTALLLRMSEDQIVNVIPPAVAGIKSINSSCRDYSFELITKIADRIFQLKQEAGLYMFIDNLSVGLQGNPKA